MKTPIIEALAKWRLKEDFDCGKPALTNYLRTIASQHQKKGLGRTYVAIEEGSNVVLGYYYAAANSS